MLGGGAIMDVGCYPLSMSKLLAGHILKKPYADPISIEASGNLDETGVDSNSKAHILFSENIEANISCAINEKYENNLEIISGDYKLSVSQPWHCGQFIRRIFFNKAFILKINLLMKFLLKMRLGSLQEKSITLLNVFLTINWNLI